MILIKNIENSTPELDDIFAEMSEALIGVLASGLFKRLFFGIEFDVMIDGVKRTDVTNEMIYKDTQKDIIIELLRYYYSDRNAGGMAYQPEGRISLNTKNFRREMKSTNAGTFFHEYLHLLGYDHDDRYDYDSVPYATGRLIKRILRLYTHKSGQTKLVRKWWPICIKKYKWV